MHSPATVFIYEFFTGGGFPAGELPDGLATEALGILWALLADFRRWGEVRTITALDSRFEERVPGLNRNTLPADEVICASPGEHEEAYLSLLKRCNAVLVIAPETSGILTGLTARADAAGIPVLGSSASATAVAGDKAICDALFRQANLPTPEARIATFASARQLAEGMNRPFVIKPLDGVGSEGVYRINHLSDLPEKLAMIRQVTSHEQILLQSLAQGVHASVCLLVAKDRCLPLSLNRQIIESGSSFEYLGSQVPFHHQACARALDLACSAVRLIPGLNGYVGVDLVLADDAAQLIEINPRLTTSYIGLRQVAQVNLAQAIWNVCRNGILPFHVPVTSQVTIIKDVPASWGLIPGD